MNFQEYDIDPEIFVEFIDESCDALDSVSDLFVKLEQNPSDIEIIQEIFRPVHSIKGNSAFFGLLHTKNLAHRLENVLDLLRNEEMGVSVNVITVLLEGTDELSKILKRVRKGDAETPDELFLSSLISKIEDLEGFEKADETGLWVSLLNELERTGKQETIAIARKLAAFYSCGKQAMAETSDTEQHIKTETSAEKEQTEERPDQIIDDADLQEKFDPSLSKVSEKSKTIFSEQKTAKTMRVPEESIDNFLNFVGELVTVGEMYSHFQSKFSQNTDIITAASELRRINEMFHALSSSLQKSLLAIRLLPVGTLLKKIPRMVRDIAVIEQKTIDVKISGETILVDKSILDALDAPLTHMVRNAADHGIETPVLRQKEGKPAAGLIEVTASISGDDVMITVEDDGKGLDFDALAQKALDMGLIASTSELTQKEIIELLFRSGVSTAETITDVSGRGVGMDVVKKSIEQKGGTISVDSKKGNGSLFTVKMPISVSTVIIRGFVTSVSTSNYIFPIEYVINAFAAKTSDIISVIGRGSCIKKGDHLIPVVSLASLPGIENKYQTSENRIMVIIESGNQKLAVAVDEIIGIRQCVLKPLEGIDMLNEYIQGVAVMGDSSVALVLNIEKVFAMQKAM